MTGTKSPPDPTLDGVVPPAPIKGDDPDRFGLRMHECIKATNLDKKTLLSAIHDGKLPAWWPGNSPGLGFRVHRRDLEAWFFSDPSRAHTPGTGSPEGPRT